MRVRLLQVPKQPEPKLPELLQRQPEQLLPEPKLPERQASKQQRLQPVRQELPVPVLPVRKLPEQQELLQVQRLLLSCCKQREQRPAGTQPTMSFS